MPFNFSVEESYLFDVLYREQCEKLIKSLTSGTDRPEGQEEASDSVTRLLRLNREYQTSHKKDTNLLYVGFTDSASVVQLVKEAHSNGELLNYVQGFIPTEELSMRIGATEPTLSVRNPRKENQSGTK